MATIQILDSDLQDAENFLVEYLTEQVPEAAFGKGGAMRDLVIKAFTYIFAYLRSEVTSITDRQSLLKITDLINSGATVDDVDQAVDEIMSNWFLTRKGGGYARTRSRCHFTQKTTVSISLKDSFWRTADYAFYIDSTLDPYVIAETEFLPVYDTRGVLIDYVVDVPMVASLRGTSYNIAAGVFVRVDSEKGIPYFSYAENLSDITSGKDNETTPEMIDRAQTAITVRNLINNRSCDTVLREEFTNITETLTIGMGEPEMVRDRKREIAPHIDIHTGGFFDTYVELPLTTTEDTGVVGGYFARTDNAICMFRDPYLTYDSSWVFTTGVKVGDILYILSGIKDAPIGYPITEVYDHELVVSSSVPFTEAYDEMEVDWTAIPFPLPTLVYSIGHMSPDFNEILPIRKILPSVAAPDVPAGTSRHIKNSGVVMLTGQPVQSISTVEITDPYSSDAAIINPSTGTILFNNRVNSDPIGPMVEPSLTQYRVQVLNPTSGQSGDAVTLVQVGYLSDPGHFDGKTLRVAYQTLTGFQDIHAYVRDRDVRIEAANHLVRARHPVWLEVAIPYRLKPTATGTVDTDSASVFLADYINNFDPNDDLDMSDLATQFRIQYPDVGAVFPFLIYYYLHAPDGQIASFSTSDIVSIFELGSNGVMLLNGNDITYAGAFVNTSGALNNWYSYMGITDRTVRYRALSSMITFYQRT